MIELIALKKKYYEILIFQELKIFPYVNVEHERYNTFMHVYIMFEYNIPSLKKDKDVELLPLKNRLLG